MDAPSKSQVDLSQITGPYPLLGLFLLVTEGLLGYWMFRAETSIERTLTGVVMLLLLGAFLYVVIHVKRADGTASTASTPVKPPEGVVTEKELIAQSTETMTGPDRSYVIDHPPEGWQTRELTLSDWVSEAMAIKDQSVKSKLFPSAATEISEVLVLERKSTSSLIPIPGRTSIGGRRFPSALEIRVPAQLTILPMDRAQPPLFVERPLEQNFLLMVGQLLSGTPTTLRHTESGMVGDGKRRYLTAELQQELSDCLVDGNEAQNVILNIVALGVEGELRDHILVVRYLMVPGVEQFERDFNILNGLVASFRPLKVANAEKVRQDLANRADEKFKQFLAENGQQMFSTQMTILAWRLKGANLDDPDVRANAMKQLRPFELMAREVGVQDEAFDGLWAALHRAEAGDATDLKEQLSELIETFSEDEIDEDKGELEALGAADVDGEAAASVSG